MATATFGAEHQTGVDLAAVKAKQQATWASGDFSVVASRIVHVAEELCETADLQAGWKVLDVATGSGNAAIAAARRGCEVVGSDYVPALLERGRIRAVAEHLDVRFVEGDAEALPFADASFDAVLSVYGAMFAPDQKKAARELLRVCKPGGKIALASWTPTGYIGEMFRLVGRYIAPIAGPTPPVMWGDENHLRGLFGIGEKWGAGSIISRTKMCVFRYPSAEDCVAFFRTHYGPTLKTFAALSSCQQDSLAKEMAALALKFDRNKAAGAQAGPIAIAGEYLESVIVKP